MGYYHCTALRRQLACDSCVAVMQLRWLLFKSSAYMREVLRMIDSHTSGLCWSLSFWLCLHAAKQSRRMVSLKEKCGMRIDG